MELSSLFYGYKIADQSRVGSVSIQFPKAVRVEERSFTRPLAFRRRRHFGKYPSATPGGGEIPLSLQLRITRRIIFILEICVSTNRPFLDAFLRLIGKELLWKWFPLNMNRHPFVDFDNVWARYNIQFSEMVMTASRLYHSVGLVVVKSWGEEFNRFTPSDVIESITTQIRENAKLQLSILSRIKSDIPLYKAQLFAKFYRFLVPAQH